MKNTWLITIIAVLIVGAIAFYGGMKYQQMQRGNRQFVRGQFGQGFGSGTNGMGSRPVSGKIMSADGKSITVQLSDGSSKIVLISDTTKIIKAATASAKDLKADEQVFVVGTTNSDGSVTATNIQLNPFNRTALQGK